MLHSAVMCEIVDVVTVVLLSSVLPPGWLNGFITVTVLMVCIKTNNLMD